jgi:hypothetical protein
MLRRVVFACAVLLAFASFSPAEAGIPIPCTATRLLQAPDALSAKDARGRAMVLHYAVSGCSGGQWDGYLSADGKYHKLTPAILSSLPKAPGFWASAWQNKGKFWVEWLWVALGIFVVGGTLLTQLPVLTGALVSEERSPSVRGR